MTIIRRKLIEVSMPLEAINKASAQEKSIRHGQPATLHMWWSRKPLTTARAVLFAQLVDDPSSHPEKFVTNEDQRRERARLHDLIGRLVDTKNLESSKVFDEAKNEIMKSNSGKLPKFLDPFCGGGSIPLEAQRLGMESNASDLNPVAVLITKALVEIPPRFKNMKPVYPGLRSDQIRTWSGTEGLAADIQYYGEWMRNEVAKEIGNLYPKVVLADSKEAQVISWIWARTVECPNPQCRIEMPLVNKWWLSKKKGKSTFISPQVISDPTISCGKKIRFKVIQDAGGPTEGTVGRTGAICVSCGSNASLSYIRTEGQAGRIRIQLMAIAAEGDRKRIYFEADELQISAADVKHPELAPDGEISKHPQYMGVPRYGMTTFGDLFTSRQATTLTNFVKMIEPLRKKVQSDAAKLGIPSGVPFESGGIDSIAYSDAIATYLAMTISRLADLSNSLCGWEPLAECPRHLFARQAIPMAWDFAEGNPLGDSSGSWRVLLRGTARSFASAAFNRANTEAGEISKNNAATRSYKDFVISTDPPYYDYVPYSDLSDFFYSWLRPSLNSIFPTLFETVLSPKSDELVADSVRNSGKSGAKEFFEQGFTSTFHKIREDASVNVPVTVYYAFKQSEASAGWESILEGMVKAGWSITATWPVRSESANRMRSQSSNVLASSIVLVLRPRPDNAPAIDRRGFISNLHLELPKSLRELQMGEIAPVDLPQAAIGPGMAIFSRYSGVIESDGSKMSVKSALDHINEVLDEVLSEQEGDFDSTTRFGIAWYRQYGYSAGKFGDADSMARARNASVDYLDRSGILSSRAGKVALIMPADLPENYDPISDSDISAWEVLHHLIRVLDTEGLSAAGNFLAKVSNRADGGVELDLVKELAFLLFSIADSNNWTKDAIAFNNVATSWGETISISRQEQASAGEEPTFDYEYED